ncbi:major facilitator superfamily domain-containing protein [Chlamydoabsidia padenii]|nr:major facilitator superfamily domain-containing protein [Chlamydoabsidia padenii]
MTNEKAPVDSRAIRRRKFKRGMTLLALQATLFLSALDATIISTSLPKIGSEFNEFTIALWVANAYYLSYDAFLPLFSSFNDIFGRKWTLLMAISVFLVGSLLCGVASSMIILIVCRAVAGIGASGIYSAVFVIISEMAPLEKRGNYHGLINAVYAVASIFGPLVGGSLTDHLSWRWCFYINLPIGGAAILLLIFYYESPSQDTICADTLKRIDYAGTFLLLSAAILFQLGLNFGGILYPWTSVRVLVPLILSVILLCVFIAVECKLARDPIIPPRLFTNRSVAVTLLVDFWFGACMFAFIFYFSIYLQTIKGDSATWSGIRLIPMQLTVCIASTIVGFLITKTGLYRPGLWIGMILLVGLVFLISLFDITTPFYQIYLVTATGGIGMGTLFSSTIISLQAAAEPKDISIVTGLNNFITLLGGSVGVSTANSVLTATLVANLPLMVPREYVQPIIDSSFFVRHGLPSQYQAAALQVYNHSLRMVWYVMIGLTAIGLIGSFFVKHCDLQAHGSSGPSMDMDQGGRKEPTGVLGDA